MGLSFFTRLCFTEPEKWNKLELWKNHNCMNLKDGDKNLDNLVLCKFVKEGYCEFNSVFRNMNHETLNKVAYRYLRFNELCPCLVKKYQMKLTHGFYDYHLKIVRWLVYPIQWFDSSQTGIKIESNWSHFSSIVANDQEAINFIRDKSRPTHCHNHDRNSKLKQIDENQMICNKCKSIYIWEKIMRSDNEMAYFWNNGD